MTWRRRFRFVRLAWLTHGCHPGRDGRPCRCRASHGLVNDGLRIALRRERNQNLAAALDMLRRLAEFDDPFDLARLARLLPHATDNDHLVMFEPAGQRVRAAINMN
jgi:hypothetical protein